jgi:hypothetical protein
MGNAQNTHGVQQVYYHKVQWKLTPLCLVVVHLLCTISACIVSLNEVSYTIQNETHRIKKNKVVKLNGTKMYLTQ